MMEFLMTRPVLPIQFADNYVMVWGQDFLSIPEIEAAAETIKGIFERFPGYLVKQSQEKERSAVTWPKT
jgi:hypothetical protein